jgi:hypothetical protein
MVYFTRQRIWAAIQSCFWVTLMKIFESGNFCQKEFWIDGIHGHEQRRQRHKLKIGVLTMVTQMLLYERLF